MLSHIVVKLLLSASVFGINQTTPEPTPTEPTAAEKTAATAKGTATGESVGGGVVDLNQQGYSTQGTSYNSLFNSSVDSMMNGQQGQTSATLMASSLANAAGPYANSCDPHTLSGLEACAAGSVLTGMSDLMKQSAPSYDNPILQAWNNVCHYSSIGCTAPSIPNPFSPIVQNIPPVDPILDTLTKTFGSNGFSIDPKTGIVKTPDGKIINPNNSKSVENGLGEDGNKNLKNLLDRMQKNIASKLAKIKRNQYLQALGLGNQKDLQSTLAGEENTKTDIAKKDEIYGKGSRRVHYNKLPEKVREQTEVAELMKSYNGTPIGVAAGNIFKMIKKRYEIKVSQKVFILPLPLE